MRYCDVKSRAIKTGLVYWFLTIVILSGAVWVTGADRWKLHDMLELPALLGSLVVGVIAGRRRFTRLLVEWRREAGKCVRCGYDLHGNANGECPECGTAVSSAPTDKGPSLSEPAP
jgi:hypothetical protein